MFVVKPSRTSTLLSLVLSLSIAPALLSQDKPSPSPATTDRTVAVNTAGPATPAGLPNAPTPATKNAATVPAPPPPPPSLVPPDGPLKDWGTILNQKGIIPTMNVLQFFLTNPSLGQQTGNHEALTLITVGGEFDLNRLLGFQGAQIHFSQLFVPITRNLAYGNIDVGDELGGQPPPYIPQLEHLTQFTWEQKLFRNHLDFELGKSNAGNNFALTVCNQAFTCQSVLVQDSGGMGLNPAPYGNWLGRVAYNFTPKATLQVGEWRSTAAFPFTNGWELNKKATDSNVYGANFVYKTNSFIDKYPKSYELMFYHNTATQAPPGTAFSPYGPPAFSGASHHGTNGMFIGAKQMVYRPDGGKGGPFPVRALSVFANDITSFDSANTTGVGTQANLGIIMDAPFKSRPHDSVSLKLQLLHLTQDEQNFLKAANLGAGGSGYTVGPNETGIGPDANIILPKNVILCPYAVRSFGANSFMNPWYAGKPQNGWAAGIVMVFLLDKTSGLAPAH